MFETDGFGGLIPTFTLGNYLGVLTSGLTFNLYYETIKFTFLTWVFTLILGFLVAYFLVFHVRNQLLAIGLFLLCTVPFWTSNIIRMISWIPLLGKEGLINSALIKLGLIHEPLTFLLYSSFAVVVAYVHQLTIFMIVPIFNSMARIDKRDGRGGGRRGREPARHHAADRDPAVEERRRARLDLRRRHRDGRFLRHQGDVGRRLGLGGRRVL